MYRSFLLQMHRSPEDNISRELSWFTHEQLKLASRQMHRLLLRRVTSSSSVQLGGVAPVLRQETPVALSLPH